MIKNSIPEEMLARHGMVAAPPELLGGVYKKVHKRRIQRRSLFFSVSALAISLLCGFFLHLKSNPVSPESLSTSAAYIDEIFTSIAPADSISNMAIYSMEDETSGIPELFNYENESESPQVFEL